MPQASSSMPYAKYPSFGAIDLPERSWPTKVIDKAPLWCSVDLRDGNQALIEPMDPERKLRMFTALCDMGFTEIEVGFPAASEPDFSFVRQLIDDNLIPDNVTIQVLTQARSHLIERTYEAIEGADKAIVHLYNSTSTLQRKVVFNLDEAGITNIAVQGAEACKHAESQISGTDIRYEYSPESFTGTELPFAKQICEAVMDVFSPTPSDPLILNLPATVEMATANTYGDQIEWFHRNITDRDSIVLSLHPHNDRGTGVAAAEFGMMAGADRVEGTLFGNGERTGNVDIVTLALNLFTQGVDPELEISDINKLRRVAEYCNQLPVHPRHPYVGDLVYTAFSGSHQDAIKKGLEARTSETETSNEESVIWEVPYLPIDPSDVGRNYEDIIRVNSQSGKGGVAFLLKSEQGLDLPRRLQIEFTRTIQKVTEETGQEISGDQIWNHFESTYLRVTDPYELISYTTSQNAEGQGATTIKARLKANGEELNIEGHGNGVVEAFISAVEAATSKAIKVIDYSQHSVGTGSDASAVSYFEMSVNGVEEWGVGLNSNTTRASLEAIISAVNLSSE